MLIQSFSGIRGIYGKDLTDEVVRRYACVFNEFLKGKIGKIPKIVVGYDTRLSNKALKKAVFDSLYDIIDVGIMPIPAIELAVREYKANGGIAITASHNEPEYNGLKFLDKDGAVLRPDDIGRVIKNFNKKEKITIGNKKKTIVKKNSDLINRYSKFLKKIVGNADNKTKVLLDVNGGSGIILKGIINKLQLDNTKIINGKAGEFKRKVEPTENSLKYLKKVIKKENAD